jgi:hypothetical protein
LFENLSAKTDRHLGAVVTRAEILAQPQNLSNTTCFPLRKQGFTERKQLHEMEPDQEFTMKTFKLRIEHKGHGQSSKAVKATIAAP